MKTILSSKRESGKIWIAMKCPKPGHSEDVGAEQEVVGASETERGIVNLIRKTLDGKKPRWLQVQAKREMELKWVADPDRGDERSWWILIFCVETDSPIGLNSVAASSLFAR